MRRLFSLTLALLMCWSVVSVLIPTAGVSAVETGNATLTGERYTVDWTIPKIGSASMMTTSSGSTDVTPLEDLEYEILGYVSPKYPDNRAVNNSESGEGELFDGKKGSNHFLNDPWVGLYGNEQNAVVVDLGAFYTNISDVSLNLLSDPELGIFLPSKITVASSADGVTYNYVGEVETMTGTDAAGNTFSSDYSVPTEYASVTYDVNFLSDFLFKGQYVLFVFEHAVGDDGFDRFWTFISEITINTSGSAVVDDFTGVDPMTLKDKPTGESVYPVNVALNSNYQVVGSLGIGRFADTGRSELTNGVEPNTDINTSNDYVSVTPADGSFAIQVDLGVQAKNISSISISGFGGGSTGYVVPTAIQLYAATADDRETYYSVGLATITTDVSGSVYTINYDVTNNKAFDARYLTFIISASGNVLLDEFFVSTTNASEPVKNVALDAQYKYLLKTASSSFNDNDWTGTKNSDGLPLLNTYGTGDLNNGISATGTFLDPAWVGYNYSGSVTDYVDIVFDLGEQVEGINNVSFKLLDYTNSSTTSNCSVPDTFTVFYSNEEDSFKTTSSTIGTVGSGEYDTLVVNSAENRRQIYKTYIATPNNVTARYVMIRIPKSRRELHIDEIKICTGNITPAPPVDGDYATLNYDVISGVWLDVFTITDLYLVQGTYQADEQTYRTRLNNYLTAMVEGGINTIMIHTRSHGDALYGDYTFDSISPYSKRYTGSLSAVSTYDAFEIFIEEAHKKGLSVHAWINPLRIGYASDLNAYSDEYEVKQIFNGNYKGEEHSDYVGMSSDNLYWLNIGYESIRFHIIDTVMEIVNNYNIDAIIMDDYFYPAGATASFDEECYSAYTGTMELGDWRRENTNMLVRALYKNIKLVNPDVLFGISPAGNITNYENSYNYTTMFADVRKWCQETWTDGEGNTYLYMDYISPQLYWAPDDQFATVTRYSTRYRNNYIVNGYLGDWMKFNYAEGVKLVVSLGLYRNFDTTISSEYLTDNVIYDQLVLMRRYMLDTDAREYNPVNSSNQGLDLVYGQILYRSHSLYDDFSVNVNDSDAGWATNEALTLQRNLDIRNELKLYWQSELLTGWDGSGN